MLDLLSSDSAPPTVNNVARAVPLPLWARLRTKRAKHNLDAMNGDESSQATNSIGSGSQPTAAMLLDDNHKANGFDAIGRARQCLKLYKVLTPGGGKKDNQAFNEA